MGKTLVELSKGLKDYINNVGITEEQVLELINSNVPIEVLDVKQQVAKNTLNISTISNNVNILENKMLEILVYLDLSNNTETDSTGYWYDPLTNGNNIIFMEGAHLDADRQRIFGAPGNVIFKNLEIPFVSDQIRITVNIDNNFLETTYKYSASVGDKNITVDNYTYKVE